VASQPFFRLAIKDVFSVYGRGVVFKGTIGEGTVSPGDKLEYFENDGTKIQAAVKKIITKHEAKLFGVFPFMDNKEIQCASRGQEVSILVGDLFNLAKQCSFSPPLEGGGYLQKISMETLQSFTS
jgi:translation elongation factor EF-Tu-like GTPase